MIKLTLIVNVMTENNEKKTVGTTFANFRKEGIQTFQVSECSCKDKAFEVDISFSLKIAEVKSSKSNINKNPLAQDKKLSNPLNIKCRFIQKIDHILIEYYELLFISYTIAAHRAPR